MPTSYQWGSWAFFWGCSAFSYDTWKYGARTRPGMMGCALFNVGSMFFLHDAYSKGQPADSKGQPADKAYIFKPGAYFKKIIKNQS